MTASKIFLYFCLSFIGGIFLNSFFNFPQLILLGLLILGIFLITILWRLKKLVVLGFCILFLVLGIWRHELAEIQISKSKLQIYNDREEIITLIGIVSTEPDIREKSQKLTVKIKEIQNLLALTQESKGLVWENPEGKPSASYGARVLITTNRYPEYRYGDKLKITGKLKTPQVFEDFNYKDYLKKDGIYSVMDWPKIELIEKNQGNLIFAKILSFKEKLRESIEQNLSPPQSSILGAIILGDKRKISEEWKNKLNVVGIRHITAVSGLHVTVLSSILMTILLALGFWRQQAFFGAILIITLFIVMTGLQPSAIRAGIMGGLFLLAQYFGRMNSASRAIFFAGAVMLAQNPLLLKFDVGFQLSFLAMLGIIYLLEIFRDWLKFIPWEGPKSVLAMTLSAYLFTLPVLIYNFGYISFVAPLANILIVPLLYWIMIFGFLFALSGMILPIFGWILSFPTWFLLSYLVKIVDWFSKIPLAYKTLENIHWIWLVISYLILGFITWRLNEKQKLKFLNY